MFLQKKGRYTTTKEQVWESGAEATGDYSGISTLHNHI